MKQLDSGKAEKVDAGRYPVQRESRRRYTATAGSADGDPFPECAAFFVDPVNPARRFSKQAPPNFSKKRTFFFDKIRIFSPNKNRHSAQRIELFLVVPSKSFDISLTFAFSSGTLFPNKAALLNESYYIALFVRSAASPNRFAAIHPRQNLLVLRGLFLFERLAAGQPARNSSYAP